MLHNFVGLQDFRRYLGVDESITGTSDDLRMLSALDSGVALIEQAAGRRFSPYVASRPQRLNPRYPFELLLDADLQALSSLTDGDGQSIDLERVDVLFGAILRLKDGTTFSKGLSNILRPITVSGIWGYSNDWRASGDTLTGVSLTASDTVLNVNDVNGGDTHARTPRFQAGQLLRIGPDAPSAEYLRVVAVDADNDQLIVLRAQNGSTSDGYIPTTPIDVFTPPPHIEALVLRVAAWLYHGADVRSGAGLPPDLWREVFALQRLGVA